MTGPPAPSSASSPGERAANATAPRRRVSVGPDGRFHWLELNTLPALRRTATLPLMAAAVGIGYEELVERVLLGACTPRD
ncbi:hypothetical protein ACFQ6N_32885 [Kitasatospora sp. NPDC056446]|uniref:hypothetical protein n=1 Tax=Kitasatospora sp. NPDC056446 TaxID=3345819 RepID=UPI0036ABFCDE